VTITTATAPSPPTRTRRGRRPSTRAEIVGVALVCATSGIVAALTADASPTGTTAFDVMWRAAIVVVTAIAGARSRRWSLAVGGGLVAVGAAGWWSLAGLGAIGVTYAMAWEDRRHRIAGSMSGALIGLAALHLGWPRQTFATAVLAAVACGVVWVSGYRTSSRRIRRRVRIGLIGLAVVVALGIIGASVFGLTQRSNVQSSIEEALAAADRIEDDSTQASVAGFDAARTRLDEVVAAVEAPWMLPARVVPGLGANLQAVRHAASAGSDLAAAAGTLAGQVDYERLRLAGGGIDLGVLSGFSDPLRSAETALVRSKDALGSARSPLVVSPVATRLDELAGRVEKAHTQAVTARMGVDAAPGLLGADGPRRYLLLLGNPAEARDLGGHIGNWAEIVADGGRIEVVRVGQPYDLFGPMSANRPLLPDPSAYPRSLTEMEPTRFPQNWGATPDLPTVARLAAELYPQVPGGAPIDGVLYADPVALAAAMEITGPVTAPGTDLQLTSANAAEFLERGQYSAYSRESIGDQAVTDLVEEVLNRLLEGDLPSPREASDAFGPAVAGGHLKFFSLHRPEEPFLRRLGIDGAVRHQPGSDLLAVISRNANPSKIDFYLERKIEYRVSFDPETGDVRSQVVVTLTNTAPAGELPAVVGNLAPGTPPGTNRTELAVLTPFTVSGATLDGHPAALGTRTDVDGLQRHTLALDLSPGATRTATFDLAGHVDGPDYRLRWIAQPLVNPDDATLVIRSSGSPFRGGASSGRVDLPSTTTDIVVRVER